MANYTAAMTKHATLAPGVVDRVTLTRPRSGIEVLNRGQDPIYFSADGRTPTVEGDNILVVMPGGSIQVNSGTGVVALISAGATAYSVLAGD